MLPRPCLPTTLACCLRITISFCWRGSVKGSKKRERIINSMMSILSCSWVRSEESGEVFTVGKRFSHKAAFCQRRNQEIVPLLQTHGSMSLLLRARGAVRPIRGTLFHCFVFVFMMFRDGGVVAPRLSSSSSTQKTHHTKLERLYTGWKNTTSRTPEGRNATFRVQG